MNYKAFFIPTEEFIENLAVGGLAPNCFGKWSKVVKVIAKDYDINGKPFVCYYTEFGNNGSSISHSLKAGELDRTTKLSSFLSVELDDIEVEMKKRNISTMSIEEYKDRHSEG